MDERVTTESVARGAAGKVTGDMAGFSRDLAADLLDARATIVALTAERDAERARVRELEAELARLTPARSLSRGRSG